MNDINPSHRPLDDDISVHIFSASAAMVGVCLTVIGIIRVVIALRKTNLFVDDLLSIDAMLYLAACFCAYGALRTRRVQRNHQLERAADGLFLIALALTVVCAASITWAISAS